MKIAVAGTGYVGLSLATLLSQKYEVVALDIVPEKIDLINKRISPIKDEYIEKFFKEKKLHLKATLDYQEAFKDAEYIIISTPTNYDEEKKFFDTSSVEDIIRKARSLNTNTTIVVKSTVPVGFIENVKRKYKIDNIFFSPEFLREGKALYDNLYPSRIIIGERSEESKIFASLLQDCARKKSIPTLYMNSTEAEAVKLFANTYLALRVAFFNELDTFALEKNLNTKDIIDGVSLDPRIGNYYNNPSFGYGGYCLPKDSRELFSSYGEIPENIIEAVVMANDTRKRYIVNFIEKENPKIVGIYRLIMKSKSDNFRESSIRDIIEYLKEDNIKVVIYEPYITSASFLGCKVIKDFKEFTEISNIILANRIDKQIKKIKNKVFSRDIYYEN